VTGLAGRPLEGAAPSDLTRRALLQRGAGLALGVAAGPLVAQPAARVRLPQAVGRVRWRTGALEVAPAGGGWLDAPVNVPLTHGSQLRTGAQSVAELRLGPTALFLGPLTTLQLQQWDSDALHLVVLRGQVALQARLQDEQGVPRVRLETGALAWQLAGNGSYHVAHLPVQRRAEVDVFDGEAWLGGDRADALRIPAGRARSADPRTGAPGDEAAAEPRRLDGWAARRQQQAERLGPALRAAAAVTGIEDLPGQGGWRQDARLGWLWTPQTVDPDWAPFRQGRWWWLPPWGWHWVDRHPWGFVTAHHGRWAFLAGRWSWVPELGEGLPPYVPATVAFLELPPPPGSASDGAIGWFPLAPGEPYRPAFDTDERFRRRLEDRRGEPREPRQLRHAQTSFAVSVLPRARFGRPDATLSEPVSPLPAQLASARPLEARQLPPP
jgi:hypothetical protein